MNRTNIRILLAARLREYRIKSGMTAKEVGEKVGKSEKTVSAWEHGRGQPDADMLFELCNLYGISSFDVFYNPDSVDPAIDPEEHHLLTTYRSLNPRGRQAVLSYVEVVAGNPDMKKGLEDQVI